MDKKQLYAVIDSIVEEVKTTQNLEESEARTFVGVALRRNREAFIKAVEGVQYHQKINLLLQELILWRNYISHVL